MSERASVKPALVFFRTASSKPPSPAVSRFHRPITRFQMTRRPVAEGGWLPRSLSVVSSAQLWSGTTKTYRALGTTLGRSCRRRGRRASRKFLPRDSANLRRLSAGFRVHPSTTPCPLHFSVIVSGRIPWRLGLVSHVRQQTSQSDPSVCRNLVILHLSSYFIVADGWNFSSWRNMRFCATPTIPAATAKARVASNRRRGRGRRVSFEVDEVACVRITASETIRPIRRMERSEERVSFFSLREEARGSSITRQITVSSSVKPA